MDFLAAGMNEERWQESSPRWNLRKHQMLETQQELNEYSDCCKWNE